jgi:hypothetical protein
VPEINDKLFYYNRIQRVYGFHVHDCGDPKIGIDHCGDCGILCELFRRYSEKYAADTSGKIRKLLRLLSAKLVGKTAHGHYFNKFKDIYECVEHIKIAAMVDYVNSSFDRIKLSSGISNAASRYHFKKYLSSGMENNFPEVMYGIVLLNFDFFGAAYENVLMAPKNLGITYNGVQVETWADLHKLLLKPSDKPVPQLVKLPIMEGFTAEEILESHAYSYFNIYPKSRPTFVAYEDVESYIPPGELYSISLLRIMCVRAPGAKYISLLKDKKPSQKQLDRKGVTIILYLPIRAGLVTSYYIKYFKSFTRACVCFICFVRDRRRTLDVNMATMLLDSELVDVPLVDANLNKEKTGYVWFAKQNC